MIERLSQRQTLAEDAELRRILRQHDPVAPPSETFLAALESDILAQLGDPPQDSAPLHPQMPLWMIPQNWEVRGAAVLAVLLIVVAGFVVGRATTVAAPEASLAAVPSLFALADEGSGMPVADTSWGDDDDNAE